MGWHGRHGGFLNAGLGLGLLTVTTAAGMLGLDGWFWLLLAFGLVAVLPVVVLYHCYICREWFRCHLDVEASPTAPRAGEVVTVRLRLLAKQRLRYLGGDVALLCQRRWSKAARPDSSWFDRIETPHRLVHRLTDQARLAPGETWTAEVEFVVPPEAPASGQTPECVIVWWLSGHVHLVGSAVGAVGSTTLEVRPALPLESPEHTAG